MRCDQCISSAWVNEFSGPLKETRGEIEFRVRLFDRYEYLLISYKPLVLGESGCFGVFPAVLAVVIAGQRGDDGAGQERAGTASGRGFRGSGGRVRDDGRESFPAGTWRRRWR